MENKLDLQQRLKELKLEKRDLVLSGKNTIKIDDEIVIVEKLLNSLLLTTK